MCCCATCASSRASPGSSGATRSPRRCSTSSPCLPRPGCFGAASTSGSTSSCAWCPSRSAGSSSGWWTSWASPAASSSPTTALEPPLRASMRDRSRSRRWSRRSGGCSVHSRLLSSLCRSRCSSACAASPSASARRATTRSRPARAMSWEAAAWLMLGGSTVLLFLGLPVAFSFLVINLVGAVLFLGGEAGVTQLARNSVGSVATFSLTPIPLFILMGELLFHTGLAEKVIDGVERLIRQVPGRLAVVAVVAGTVFSAISGSTIATTAMLGSLMLPVMLSRGYHPTMATGPLMAIGAVDMLIPPSALTVLLGSMAGIAISKLLIGGVMPGLILSLAFIVYIVVRVKMNPSLAPAASFTEYRGWEKFRPLVQYVVPLVSIFVVVVASMSAGWATPTESAAIGALFTFLLAAAYRAITVDNLLKALRGTAAISGMILFIIVGAMTFSQILSFSGASSGMVEIIATLGLPPLALIAAMMLVLIFLGLFVEQVSMMMITLPIFMPLVQKFGVDPVWFGVMFLICMQLGLLLPPHGLLLMTMKGVSPPQVTMGHIFRAVVPYIFMSLVVLALVFFVPAVAVWLPSVLF